MATKKVNHEVLKQFESWRKSKMFVPRETFDKDYYLIELFKYEAKDKTEVGATKTILIPDGTGSYKSKKEVENSRFLPIARILDIGEGTESKYEVGDIVTVPSNDVNGIDVWNPDFMKLQQFKGTNLNHKIPQGMREKISSLEYKWDKYRYFDPFDFDTGRETTLYLVPAIKIRGRWNG